MAPGCPALCVVGDGTVPQGHALLCAGLGALCPGPQDKGECTTQIHALGIMGLGVLGIVVAALVAAATKGRVG